MTNKIQEIIDMLSNHKEFYCSLQNKEQLDSIISITRVCYQLKKELSDNKDTEILDYKRYNNDFYFHNMVCQWSVKTRRCRQVCRNGSNANLNRRP